MNYGHKLLHRLRQNKSGNVAIITALSALPMIGLFGLCIDYGIAVSNKSKLDAAADAAAVAAITTAQAALFAKSPDAVAQGKARGLAVFAANVGKINFSSASAPPVPDIDVTLSPDGMSVQAKVSYSASSAAQFGRLFNVSKMQVSGSSQSTLGVSPNVEIYLMVDISQSMGVAATQNDMNKLYKATASVPSGACVFACHDTDGNNIDTYQLAKAQHITLRIDVIKDAISSMIRKADDNSKLPNSKPTKLAIYTFDMNLKSAQTAQSQTPPKPGDPPPPPTKDYSYLRQAVSRIELALDHGNLFHADTYTQAALKTAQKDKEQIGNMTDIIGKSGDGTSEDSPKKYLFIMTDGTSDTVDSGNQKVIPYDPSWVKTLKDNGVTVGVVYTTYLPFYAFNNPQNGLDSNYQQWISPINGPVSKIKLGLEDSVTAPPWFIEASDSTAIAAALTNLLAQAQNPPRLTN